MVRQEQVNIKTLDDLFSLEKEPQKTHGCHHELPVALLKDLSKNCRVSANGKTVGQELMQNYPNLLLSLSSTFNMLLIISHSSSFTRIFMADENRHQLPLLG